MTTKAKMKGLVVETGAHVQVNVYDSEDTKLGELEIPFTAWDIAEGQRPPHVGDHINLVVETNDTARPD